LIPGDWHETMSTHWFHDHMFSFTAQNVYKGNMAMLNIYSGLDRGNEAIDGDGQLLYDIFNFDGFLGDVMAVNFAYKPYFEVERRKYRFRILNGSVARFLKIALANSSGAAQPMTQIANDGNLMPHPVALTVLDEQAIADRYDVVIDFSRSQIGEKLYLVNLAEHDAGRGPDRFLTVADAFAGNSSTPGVGRFLEFRVVRDPAQPDRSRVPDTLIPNPDHS